MGRSRDASSYGRAMLAAAVGFPPPTPAPAIAATSSLMSSSGGDGSGDDVDNDDHDKGHDDDDDYDHDFFYFFLPPASLFVPSFFCFLPRSYIPLAPSSLDPLSYGTLALTRCHR